MDLVSHELLRTADNVGIEFRDLDGLDKWSMCVFGEFSPRILALADPYGNLLRTESQYSLENLSLWEAE